MLFEEVAEQWLSVKKLDIGQSQHTVYRCALKHLAPIWGKDIADVRMSDIQAIIANLAAHNPNTGKPAAKKTLRDIKMTAKQVLQYAIDNQYITYNAAKSVSIPRNAPKTTRRALTDDERRKITNTPHKLRTAAMLMLYAGLRRGEVIPLRWTDINLQTGTISVNKAVDLTGNTPVIKQPKTEAGCRLVHMPSVLTVYLSSIPRFGDLVISPKLMSKMMWRNNWEKYTQALGIPDVTAHMLRHTACTMMIEAGMDVASVKNQMGHSDIQTTLNIYTHVTQNHTGAEVKKLDAYIQNAAG